MQTEDIDREIAATMANTPREPDESKQAYQVRARQLTYERLDKAKRYLDQIAAQWDDAAERLRAFVEDQE